MLTIEKFGMIGAMDEEIALVRDAMTNVTESRKAGIVFYEGTFAGKSAVLCKCGVGKVNAAVCTQVLIDSYRVDAVVFTGVAGALDPGLDIGDIVVSTECLQHDMDVTALGFARGVIPYQEQSVFSAHQDLVRAAFSAATSLFPDRRVVQGKVLSGDQFVASRDAVRDLYEQFSGTCTEMEGAAVAQACHMNEIPFVVIRSMSDKADGSAHVDFEQFTSMASQHSYRIVEAMIQQL